MEQEIGYESELLRLELMKRIRENVRETNEAWSQFSDSLELTQEIGFCHPDVQSYFIKGYTLLAQRVPMCEIYLELYNDEHQERIEKILVWTKKNLFGLEKMIVPCLEVEFEEGEEFNNEEFEI